MNLTSLIKAREKVDVNINDLITKIVTKEIQSTKDNNPTNSELIERNIRRIYDLKNKKAVYCPIVRDIMENLTICHLFCQYGHITECHYPFECEPEKCNHFFQGKNELNQD